MKFYFVIVTQSKIEDIKYMKIKFRIVTNEKKINKCRF